jgi:hypothetical protein
MAAQSITDQRIAQMVTDAANAAFVSGMAEAMLVGAAVLVVASVLAFALLPAKLGHSDNNITPGTTGNHLVKDEESEAMTP